MPLLLFFGLAASAAEVGVFATLGGDASTGLRTGLDGLGPHTELAVELGGPKNAAHLGQRTYVTQVKDAWFCIPGLNLGWAHSFGDDATLGGYSLVAVGGYRSEVLPVMPILGLSGGVQWTPGPLTMRAGPHVFALPPFFVGGGLELSVGAQF
ncbi:hypothetical protein L6R46_21870 [Myxococcota bacterium]|jgi:hypothetical protein|nr:hypothetical protein [Myxococcota bacterium]